MSRLNILPDQSYKSINAWILYVALPALSLRYVPEIIWSWKILLSVLGPLVVWCGAWLYITLYSRSVRLDRYTKTALIVTCGLGNTAFLGFPMISAFYGEEQIRNAIVFDQVTFLLFSTVAVLMVLRTNTQGSSQTGFAYVIKKILRFPPFIACMLALILPNVLNLSVINPFLDKLVATVSPLALFSIGLQIRFGEWKKQVPHLTAGLLYKLMLAPILVLILVYSLHGAGDQARINVFEASMPSHITASLLAGQYNLNPGLCNLMVGVGIFAGFITSGFWWWVLQFFF